MVKSSSSAYQIEKILFGTVGNKRSLSKALGSVA